MDAEENILDISSEVSSEQFVEEVTPLLVFRVIACTFVTVLVGFTIIVYVTSGMSHTDCLAQINAEFCILTAYMLILLTTTEPSKINQTMCISISFFLHISFLGAFFFSLLEVICISQVLIPFFQKKAHIKSAHVIILGWGCPVAIACITTLIWLKEFTTKSNCWVDWQKPLIWPTVVPIALCICLQVILLLVIFCTTNDVPITVPASQYERAKSFLGTRWASSVILIALTSSWACGVLAYNRREEGLYAGFTVTSIMLGSCIFILRLSTDLEMRAIIKADLLCCLQQKNKVASTNIKPVRSKNAMSENRNGLINGKIVENEEESITSHK